MQTKEIKMNNTYQTFIGKLGSNPELKYTVNKKAVCNLNVAIRDTESTETKWCTVVVWERQAELCSVQLKKGHDIFVQGRSVVKSYKNKLGEDKFYNEVNARLIGFTNL
jgi:single-strand DNA-binding protein